MVLRDLAGGAARMSAGFWKEVARVIEPDRPAPHPASPPSESASPPGAEAATAGHAQAPDGVLVPVETWTRVLEQLGHLHEAGRELAEARERAAKAETQVEFLRQQLVEAKARPKRRPAAKPDAASSAAPPAVTPPARATTPQPATGTRRAVVRNAGRVRIHQARNRVSAWLQVE